MIIKCNNTVLLHIYNKRDHLSTLYLAHYLLTHSLTHSLTYSLTHSREYLLTHPLTYSLTHSLTHSPVTQAVLPVWPQHLGVAVRSH